MPPPTPPSPNRPSWADDARALRDDDEDSSSSIVLEEGTLLARKYRLVRTAGFGGMAQLWVATNEATGAEVCVKVLVPDGVDDESVKRFRREAHASARLSHRAIVRIFDFVELDAKGESTTESPAALAIVMELLLGETLGDYLMKQGKLPLDEAIDLALPILSALAHAHRAGIIHRDIKPDNIFLAKDPDGHVSPKVLDFGVSKLTAASSLTQGGAPLTRVGVMLGTPSYMSPEQARGAREIDARTDVFSVSILLYMMLAGVNPFEDERFHSVVTAILNREPARLPDVPDAIWAVLEKGLAKDTAARYADATELGIALRRACGRAATTESGVHPVLPASPSSRRIVTPLGGDSHVSVPPVGNAGDTSSNSPPATYGTSAAQKRAVRIVAVVVAAAAALTTVALLRGSSGSSGGASGGRPSPSTSVAVPSATPPPVVPTGAAPTATATAADGAGTPVTADAGAPARGGRTGGAGTRGSTKGGSTGAAPLPPPRGAGGEPGLVRDPGF